MSEETIGIFPRGVEPFVAIDLDTPVPSSFTFNIGEDFKRLLRKAYGVKLVALARSVGPFYVRGIMRKRK